MPLPLQLLRASKGHPMQVELKSGETYNGHLKACDDWMNLHLVEAVCTTPDGERFFKIAECFIRGNTIRFARVPDQRLQAAEELAASIKKAKKQPRKRPRPEEKGKENAQKRQKS